MSRAQRPCRRRTLALSSVLLRPQPPGRALVYSCHAHAMPPLTRHHLLCHNPGLEMGNSPSTWSPAHFLFVLPTINHIKFCLIPTRATGTWKTHQNAYIIQKGINLPFLFNYKLPKTRSSTQIFSKHRIRPNLAIS